MVAPFPSFVSYTHASALGALLAGGLFAEGNSPVLCVIVFCIVLVAAFGFNQGGGLSRSTGAYVLFVTLFTSLVGVTTKLILNEPLAENVSNVEETLWIYLLGTCSLSLAVVISQRFRRTTPILKNRLTFANTPRVTTGCFAAGVLLPSVLAFLFPNGSGSVGTIIAQINIALPLCILVGVYYKVRQTGGRRSFSWPCFLAFAYNTFSGLVGFSKEGMFAGAVAWGLAAAAGRYRLGVIKMMVIVAVCISAVYVLVPYSQYGRNFRLGYGGNYSKSWELLTHPLQTRRLALASEDGASLALYHWYSADHGILDRLTLIPIDAALVRQTDETGSIGWGNVGLYLINVVPHFLLPDKPNLSTGNQYAHEIGMLAGSDVTTGISFSPYAEAYHLGGWGGLLFLLPAVECLMFVALESVTGSIHESPWGLFFISYFAHGAAEGMLQIPVRMASVGVEAILACAFFMIYVTPLIASLILGPQSATGFSDKTPRAIPRRQ